MSSIAFIHGCDRCGKIGPPPPPIPPGVTVSDLLGEADSLIPDGWRQGVSVQTTDPRGPHWYTLCGDCLAIPLGELITLPLMYNGKEVKPE